MLKRSSGDDSTIWVHNSWQDEKREEAPHQSEKRALHIWEGAYNRGGGAYMCWDFVDAYDRTTANSPFTGGAHNILAWASNNRGFFDLNSGCCPYLSDLIISGSNSGANAAYSVQPWYQRRFLLGSGDIADGVRVMRDRYQKKDSRGSWRVAGGGMLECDLHGHQSRVLVDWVFRNTTKTARG